MHLVRLQLFRHCCRARRVCPRARSRASFGGGGGSGEFLKAFVRALRKSPPLFSDNGLGLISHFLRPISSSSFPVGRGTHYNRRLINAAIKIDSQILQRRGGESERERSPRLRYSAALCMDAFVELAAVIADVDASTPRNGNGDNNVFTVSLLPLDPLPQAAAHK